MGGHPVLEGHQVCRVVLGILAPADERIDIVLVAVEPLAAGDQLHPPEEEVETRRETRPLRVGVGVEGPLAHREAADKEEIRAVLALCPLPKPALVGRREVRLIAQVLAGGGGDHGLGVQEVDVGDGLRDLGQLQTEQGQRPRRIPLDSGQHAGDGVGEHSHDGVLVLDESDLGVERDVLVDVTGGVVRLGPEDGAHLVDALKDADHHLLVELRALGQVGGLAEVVEGEGGGPRLGGRADDLRGLDLRESEIVQAGAEPGHGGGLDGEIGAAAGMAESHRGVVEDGRQLRLDHGTVEVKGRGLIGLRDHRHRWVVDLDPAGSLRLGHHHPGDTDHGLVLQPGEPLDQLGILDDHLGGPAGIAEDEEADPRKPAEPVEPALELHPLTNAVAQIVGPDTVGEVRDHGVGLRLLLTASCTTARPIVPGESAGPVRAGRAEQASPP